MKEKKIVLTIHPALASICVWHLSSKSENGKWEMNIKRRGRSTFFFPQRCSCFPNWEGKTQKLQLCFWTLLGSAASFSRLCCAIMAVVFAAVDVAVAVCAVPFFPDQQTVHWVYACFCVNGHRKHRIVGQDASDPLFLAVIFPPFISDPAVLGHCWSDLVVVVLGQIYWYVRPCHIRTAFIRSSTHGYFVARRCGEWVDVLFLLWVKRISKNAGELFLDLLSTRFTVKCALFFFFPATHCRLPVDPMLLQAKPRLQLAHCDHCPFLLGMSSCKGETVVAYTLYISLPARQPFLLCMQPRQKKRARRDILLPLMSSASPPFRFRLFVVIFLPHEHTKWQDWAWKNAGRLSGYLDIFCLPYVRKQMQVLIQYSVLLLSRLLCLFVNAFSGLFGVKRAFEWY